MLVARQPLQILSTSEMQAGARRMSARLQEKDEIQFQNVHPHLAGNATSAQAKTSASEVTRGRKRKNDYEEEDDGFAFSRVKKNKRAQESSIVRNRLIASVVPATESRSKQKTGIAPQEPRPNDAEKSDENPEMHDQAKKRRKKMSFSTPKAKESQPVRRSKRLSNDAADQTRSPALGPSEQQITLKKRRQTREGSKAPEKVDPRVNQNTNNVQLTNIEAADVSTTEHSATKIALPFADTPVIRRNKAMREGKSMKGDRRSSLGLRGRRASSLIETGNSNGRRNFPETSKHKFNRKLALPHQEVNTVDFHKHIESDLMEPRRMRQLLTWCATRAMHAKPKGTGFEDASAKSAARVIEEELLKELANRSELSDWFSRQDAPEPLKPLPERANPKNIQNAQKIADLEVQINRLKAEREALQKLLRPPELDSLPGLNNKEVRLDSIDSSLLSESDAAILGTLQTSSQFTENILGRVNRISSTLEPSVDQFADGVHKVAQYRTATDNIAGKILSICAGRLADRERAGKRRALDIHEDRSPGRDLSNVLRGISKADR